MGYSKNVDWDSIIRKNGVFTEQINSALAEFLIMNPKIGGMYIPPQYGQVKGILSLWFKHPVGSNRASGNAGFVGDYQSIIAKLKVEELRFLATFAGSIANLDPLLDINFYKNNNGVVSYKIGL